MDRNKKVVLGIIAAVIAVCAVVAIVVNQGNDKDQDVIKVVALLPQTGTTSFIGNSIQRGLQIAEERFGNRIQIIYTDTEGKNEKAISEKRRLKMLEKASLFISVFSGTTKVLVPEFEGTEDLLFATCVSNANITKMSDNLFRLFLNADGDARVIARYAMDSLGKKNFAIVYVNDDFGIDYCFAFEDEIKKNGGKILAKIPFERGDIDFRQALVQLRQFSNECDAVYLLGYDNNFGVILKQYAEDNIQIPILSMATIGAPMVTDMISTYLDQLPPIYFTNTLLDSELGQNDEKKEFISLYEQRFKEKPNYFAAFAYDIIVCIANADKDNIKPSLLKNEFHGVMGTIQFNQHRDAEFPVIIEKLN